MFTRTQFFLFGIDIHPRRWANHRNRRALKLCPSLFPPLPFLFLLLPWPFHFQFPLLSPFPFHFFFFAFPLSLTCFPSIPLSFSRPFPSPSTLTFKRLFHFLLTKWFRWSLYVPRTILSLSLSGHALFGYDPRSFAHHRPTSSSSLRSSTSLRSYAGHARLRLHRFLESVPGASESPIEGVEETRCVASETRPVFRGGSEELFAGGRTGGSEDPTIPNGWIGSDGAHGYPMLPDHWLGIWLNTGCPSGFAS